MESYVIRVTKADCQLVRDVLTKKGIFDADRKISKSAMADDKKDELEIPVVSKDNLISDIREALPNIQFQLKIAEQSLVPKCEEKITTHHELIEHCKQVIFYFRASAKRELQYTVFLVTKKVRTLKILTEKELVMHFFVLEIKILCFLENEGVSYTMTLIIWIELKNPEPKTGFKECAETGWYF